jgi:hypothetical protein
VTDRLARAVLTIEVDGEPVKVALKEIGDESDETAEQVRGISQVVNLAVWRELAQVAGQALRMVVGGIVELGERGAAVADVSDSFSQLSASSGQTASVMLGALRDGVQSTLSDFELMKASNGALSSGLVRNSDDMRALAAGAKLLADRTGGDTSEAFDTLTGAISSGRTTQLRQLGLFVDNEAAVKAYARSVSKSVDDLTAQERAQALSRATLEALKSQLQAAGPAALDFSDFIAQGKAQFNNFTDALGVGVAQSPVLRAALTAVGQAMTQSFGMEQATHVRTLTGVIEQIAIGLTYVAQGGTVVATVLVTAFYAVKTVLLGVMTAISGVVAANVAFYGGLVQLAAQIPGMSGMLGGVAEKARDLDNSMRGATAGLAEQTAEAARGVMGQSSLQQAIDRTGGSIMNVRTAMQEAAARAREMGDSGADAAARLGAGVQTAAGQVQAGTGSMTMSFATLAQSAMTTTNTALAAMRQAHTHAVQDQAIAMATGLEQQILVLETRKARELENIEWMRQANRTFYDEYVAFVNAKYALLTQSARTHYQQTIGAANDAGFQTRAQLEQQAVKAEELYRRMLTSGLFTETELRRARDASGEAAAAMDGRVFMNREELQQASLSSLSSTLRAAFGKNKLAAITAALMDTYAGVAKALAMYGWPFAIPMMAATLAAGYQQVSQIRAQNASGFKTGTPGLDFMNFGSESLAALHGREAVIPQGGGHQLAGEIAGAMPEDGAVLAELRALRNDLAQLPRNITRAWQTALVMSR